MTGAPPLSVVMPVRNAGPFIDDAVASILGQSWRDYEFVILDDASDDGTSNRLAEWAGRDPRIRLVRSEEPLGPARSSQRAVELSRAPLVARMDADDLSHRDRLAREMALFESEPRAVLAGTLFDVVDRKGRSLRRLEIAPLLRPLPVVPVPHGSIMFRREAFDRVGGYRSGHDYWEDIDLYMRLTETGAVFVVPEALYTVRYSAVGTRFRADPETLDRAYRDMTARLIGAAPETAKVPLHVYILSGSPLLWAGRRPGVIGRLLRQGDLRWDMATARVLAWSLWAEASPSSLRAVLRGLAALREKTRPAFVRRPWVEWRPMSPPSRARSAGGDPASGCGGAGHAKAVIAARPAASRPSARDPRRRKRW